MAYQSKRGNGLLGPRPRGAGEVTDREVLGPYPPSGRQRGRRGIGRREIGRRYGGGEAAGTVAGAG